MDKCLYWEKDERKTDNLLLSIENIRKAKTGKVYLEYNLPKINLENIEKQIIKL